MRRSEDFVQTADIKAWENHNPQAKPERIISELRLLVQTPRHRFEPFGRRAEAWTSDDCGRAADR